MVTSCPSCGYYVYNGAPTCSRCGTVVLMPASARYAQPFYPPNSTQHVPSMTQCAPIAPAQCVPAPLACCQTSAPRAVWAFVLTIIAGILVILNAGALLSQSFYNMWVSAFFWIPAIDSSPAHGLIFVIGAIIGLTLLMGSILMVLGYGMIGSIIVFPLAIVSLMIGGGFVAGFVLGVVGGILGMLGR